ncbi:hypothetical protein IAT38_004740 [Cryptococcus sp. DSM 104549]
MAAFQPPAPESLKGKGRVGTLGMFIIDHYEVRDQAGNAVPIDDEAIGGAMIAARQFLPPTHCGLLVDRGDDFPERFARDLESLGKDMIWFRPREGKTTRALNIYSGQRIGEGHQSFQYISPQLQLTPKDLILPPSPFATPVPPEWIHVVCSTARARAIVDELEELQPGSSEHKAKFVWEPLPLSCIPDELQTILSLSSAFAIFSPNLLELQSILSIPPSPSPTHSDAETAAHAFNDLLSSRHPSQRPAIIVRAGELGSFTLSEKWTGWMPAYWTEEEQKEVVDVTGGGNSFLGGLLAGLLISDGDVRAASIYASTAASFAIQQRGPPRLDTGADGKETWNGDNVWERLQKMARRVDDLA